MPIYTYRCPRGHEWDEVRSITGSEVSQDPCPTCVEAIDSRGLSEAFEVAPGVEDLSDLAGKRVPPSSAPSVSFKGRGWTPTHYPGREHK